MPFLSFVFLFWSESEARGQGIFTLETSMSIQTLLHFAGAIAFVGGMGLGDLEVSTKVSIGGRLRKG